MPSNLLHSKLCLFLYLVLLLLHRIGNLIAYVANLNYLFVQFSQIGLILSKSFNRIVPSEVKFGHAELKIGHAQF